MSGRGAPGRPEGSQTSENYPPSDDVQLALVTSSFVPDKSFLAARVLPVYYGPRPRSAEEGYVSAGSLFFLQGWAFHRRNQHARGSWAIHPDCLKPESRGGGAQKFHPQAWRFRRMKGKGPPNVLHLASVAPQRHRAWSAGPKLGRGRTVPESCFRNCCPQHITPPFPLNSSPASALGGT